MSGQGQGVFVYEPFREQGRQAETEEEWEETWEGLHGALRPFALPLCDALHGSRAYNLALDASSDHDLVAVVAYRPSHLLARVHPLPPVLHSSDDQLLDYTVWEASAFARMLREEDSHPIEVLTQSTRRFTHDLMAPLVADVDLFAGPLLARKYLRELQGRNGAQQLEATLADADASPDAHRVFCKRAYIQLRLLGNAASVISRDPPEAPRVTLDDGDAERALIMRVRRCELTAGEAYGLCTTRLEALEAAWAQSALRARGEAEAAAAAARRDAAADGWLAAVRAWAAEECGVAVGDDAAHGAGAVVVVPEVGALCFDWPVVVATAHRESPGVPVVVTVVVEAPSAVRMRDPWDASPEVPWAWAEAEAPAADCVEVRVWTLHRALQLVCDQLHPGATGTMFFSGPDALHVAPWWRGVRDDTRAAMLTVAGAQRVAGMLMHYGKQWRKRMRKRGVRVPAEAPVEGAPDPCLVRLLFAHCARWLPEWAGEDARGVGDVEAAARALAQWCKVQGASKADDGAALCEVCEAWWPMRLLPSSASPPASPPP